VAATVNKQTNKQYKSQDILELLLEIIWAFDVLLLTSKTKNRIRNNSVLEALVNAPLKSLRWKVCVT